jgi:AbiU2
MPTSGNSGVVYAIGGFDKQSPMENIFSLPPSEQAERFRALFEYLDEQYMLLVQNFHMLVPPWTNQTLIDRFNKTERARGFQMLRASLLDTCILAIAKLLLDGEDTNPSLLTMVRPFLAGNRTKRAELLHILEHDYSDWHKHISSEEREKNPEWLIKALEEQNEKDAEASRKEFWERAGAIAADWPKLAQAGNKIRPVRNQWIAHFEVEYDPATKKYKPVELPSLLTVYRIIEEVVPIITESVSHLAGLFKGLDISTDQLAELAKRDAFAFWEI